MKYPSELLQPSLPPSSSPPSNNAVPRAVPAYSAISRSTPMFPFQSLDLGLGISCCDMEPISDHMRHYQPLDHDSVDWLGQMMPTMLPSGCSLNTSHLSPTTLYEPYAGSDASASPLSYCGPQTMSASPSRGPELDYGRGPDMTNMHAYNFWPSTPCSERDIQVKQDPDMEYRDESYLDCAKPSVPMPADEVQLRTNDLAASPDEMSVDTQNPAELVVDRDTTAEPSAAPPKIPPANGLTCTVCGAEFTRRSNCREHMKKHDPSGRKVYPCEDCGKTFGRKTDLKRHIDSVHRGIRRFECDQCGYRFTRQDTLVRHAADGCRRKVSESSSPRRKSSGSTSRKPRSRS
ncbi:hypothetical protein BJX63DRAFT_2888 [Aspergillus granulosus]|uniref:C2H2-type domain-containing protein n=1 Tax=Aspergillus granulosus TaxID=176169 RepID=A0ABR4I5E3_9EURO